MQPSIENWGRPQTPLHTLPSSKITAVADGKVAVYPGYGYKITGSSITDVEVTAVFLTFEFVH